MSQYRIYNPLYNFKDPLKAWDILRLPDIGLVQRLPGIPAEYQPVSEAFAEGKEVLTGKLVIEPAE